MNEKWVPIPGYEGLYEVSDAGRVRSLDRKHTARHYSGKIMYRSRRGGIKATTPDKDGYLNVRLCKGGKAKTLRVHRLVLISFVGADQDKPEACHLNHDKSDNSLTNLAWGTRQENEDQKTATGRRPETTAKLLTRNDVSRIFELRENGLTLMRIGEIVGTHFTNVSLILRGKTWKNL